MKKSPNSKNISKNSKQSLVPDWLPRPGSRANGSALLPLALRPGLKHLHNLRQQNKFLPLFSKKLIWAAILLSFCFVFQTSYASSVFASEISLSLPNKIELNITPSSSGSGGLSGSSPSIVSVATDNIGGYNLSIKAKSSSDLVNSTIPEAKLTTISDSLSSEQYQNGDHNNTWAFKPDYYNNEVNTIYRPGPDTKGTVLAKTTTSTIASPSGKDQYNLAIAAKVDQSIPAGQYANTFIMTATVNEIRYTIKYDADSLSGATNADSFTAQTGIISGDTQTINSATPAKDDATFTGWCDKALEADGSCKGSTIQPGGELRMCDCDTEVTLYAVWEEQAAMQDWKGCNDLAPYDQSVGIVELTDSRDGNVYKIAKLKDGKCWMVENLRLGDEKMRDRTLTPEDTDLNSGTYTLPMSTPPSSSQTNLNSEYFYFESGGYLTYGLIGGYYSWAAATAGTGTTSVVSENATSSICPKGWHLPTGGPSGEFELMSNKYGSGSEATRAIELRTTPVPNFGPYGIYNPTLGARDSNGYWYSSSATSNTSNAYGFYVGADRVATGIYTISPRSAKASVRCVASS